METKPTKVMRSFEAEKDPYAEFKSICAKEGMDVGEKLNEFIKNFNRDYGDGNPVYQLDHWFDNDVMAAVPAVMRKKQDWVDWVLKINDENFLQQIVGQGQTIVKMADSRILELRGHTVNYV